MYNFLAVKPLRRYLYVKKKSKENIYEKKGLGMGYPDLSYVEPFEEKYPFKTFKITQINSI